MSKAKCVNLREMFGSKYRIGRDLADAAERPSRRAADDPWMMTVLCQNGEVYPAGGTTLVYATTSCTALKLANHPLMKLRRLGHAEGEVSFDAMNFHALTKVIRPRVRRVLSEAQKEALARAGGFFKKREHGASDDLEGKSDLP